MYLCVVLMTSIWCMRECVVLCVAGGGGFAAFPRLGDRRNACLDISTSSMFASRVQNMSGSHFIAWRMPAHRELMDHAASNAFYAHHVRAGLARRGSGSRPQRRPRLQRVQAGVYGHRLSRLLPGSISSCHFVLLVFLGVQLDAGCFATPHFWVTSLQRSAGTCDEKQPLLTLRGRRWF